jgi:hypothetical protein
MKDWRSYNIRYAAHWTYCDCMSVRIDNTGCTLGATGATQVSFASLASACRRFCLMASALCCQADQPDGHRKYYIPNDEQRLLSIREMQDLFLRSAALS